MQLSYETIKSITTGAVSVEQTDAGIRFYRFTAEQREIYAGRREALQLKSQATAGVKFCFETDSRSLFIRGLFEHASARTYFSVDVFVDGELVDCLDNYSDVEIPPVYTTIQFPMGAYEKKFSLGEGRKTVTVHLPWNKIVTLQELSLDDGSFVTPVKQEKKLMAFGDSITQGFDALRPSRRYIARLAEALGAEEFNKAVGAEYYDPELAATKDAFTPDYIVVAYGTNDWGSSTPEVFGKSVRPVYASLRKNYPEARIFAITPIWRAAINEKRAFDSFFDIEKGVREATAGMENVTVISGIDLVPHESRYFGDGTLHPSAEGFDHYFKNLWKTISAIV